ncbi:hypothetical protein [Pseudogracilibacillus sp. SO30301A]|uniref:hypothetical protein n=1 Tax=Pseudogracilibacillus sp. SO30301A TaxID=3098291 RepID=UPI00300E016D
MNQSVLKDRKWLRLISASILLVIFAIIIAIIEEGFFWVGPIIFSIWMMVLAVIRARKLKDEK